MKAAARRRSLLGTLRRRPRALLAAVLPALLLRALIPFGFMPVGGQGGPSLELCPGVAAMAGGGHGHHHHPGGDPSGASHALCVFAASAAPALAPAPAAAPMAAAVAASAVQSDPVSLRLPSILRALAARAPPPLA